MDTQLVEKTLKRIVTTVQDRLADKRPSFQRSLDYLAQQFGSEDGPGFESTSSLQEWRTLKYTIEAYEVVLQILGNAQITNEEILRKAISFLESQRSLALGSYRQSCQSLASDFQRPSGPTGVSSAETKWIQDRAHYRVFDEVLTMLQGVKEALAGYL